MFKKFIGVFWVALFIYIAAIPAFAFESGLTSKSFNSNPIQPLFTNITLYQNTFDISSSGKSSVTVVLSARNVDKVKVEAYLQQYKNGSWTTIKNWSNTVSGTSASIGENWYVASGYSYRMLSYGTVYKNGAVVESTSYTSKIIEY